VWQVQDLNLTTPYDPEFVDPDLHEGDRGGDDLSASAEPEHVLTEGEARHALRWCQPYLFPGTWLMSSESSWFLW
jgi:hypothetical protein